MKDKIVDFLRGKKILILGYGREGKSTLEFIRRELPDAIVAVADQQNIVVENTTVISGDNYLEACKDYDIIMKAPGVVIKNDLDDATKAKVTSQTDLFLRVFGPQTIGVTGTKGKSTTSSLIAHVLKAGGWNVQFAGNIGEPCFNIIDNITPESPVVLELSSHQLEYVKASPHIAILLNMYEEHFDHYATPEDYYRAKCNIYRYQNAQDLLIYGDIFQHVSEAEIKALPQFKIDITKTEIGRAHV